MNITEARAVARLVEAGGKATLNQKRDAFAKLDGKVRSVSHEDRKENLRLARVIWDSCGSVTSVRIVSKDAPTVAIE